METLSFVTDFRDIVVIVFGIAGLIALFLISLFTVLIGFALLRLIRSARGTVQDGVKPILEEAQTIVRETRGTGSFVSDAMVRPIIRFYGIYAGVRRALGVFTRGSGGSKGR